MGDSVVGIQMRTGDGEKRFSQKPMFNCDQDIYGADVLEDLVVCATFTSKNNKVGFINQIIAIQKDQTSFVDSEYPVTKLAFQPKQTSKESALFATTGDYLRLYKVANGSLELVALLRNIRRIGTGRQELFAPLTSFDWNHVDANVAITCSIDTTCTVWDMNRQQATTQLIAHDTEVHDVQFSNEKDIFASAGADGSIRLFDLRQLQHSTILYETHNTLTKQRGGSLSRLSFNKKDDNYIATIEEGGKNCVILDRRVPAVPVFELKQHQESLSSVCWAPHSAVHILTGGDDGQALIWDISQAKKSDFLLPIKQVALATAPVCNAIWSPGNHSSILIVSKRNLFQFAV